MNKTLIIKIVSGGQTGVDRAALDVALACQIPHGGWCPAGRRAEDGKIPDRYQLKETESSDYAVRTRLNVIDSDGTLILYDNTISGGTKLTLKLARQNERPVLAIDLDFETMEPYLDEVIHWLHAYQVMTLNVAGPRESNVPGIQRRAEGFLSKLWERLQENE